MVCKSCGNLLFPKYGDGERECARCRETREEQAGVIARDRAGAPAPGEERGPMKGCRIGGMLFALLLIVVCVGPAA